MLLIILRTLHLIILTGILSAAVFAIFFLANRLAVHLAKRRKR